MKIPVEGNPGFYRDQSSGAILNCSDSEYNSYVQLKQLKLKEKEEINQLKENVSKVDLLQKEIDEIKDMMKMILKKMDSN
jgi:hypothetical protein